MVAVISKRYGLEHLEIAEDIVSETFLTAIETWKEKGVPPNPTAWLYTVAKQKTVHYFRRNKILEDKVLPQLRVSIPGSQAAPEFDFSEQNIKDSQLQMLFAICHPSIGSEAQIGLALRILFGFSIDEIAEAFLTSKETINKRLFRAKEKLRTEKIRLELPPVSEINERLDNVLHIIYLLFNEGYYSHSKNRQLRKGLCLEALHLSILLTTFDETNLPKTNALIALMCFHASRFEARDLYEDTVVLYADQNEELWDQELINMGVYYLNTAATGNEVSSYHLEASIAFWHSQKADTIEKWENILHLYNLLLQINYSPTVALNRTYALYKAEGYNIAIVEAEKLKLDNNPLYYMLFGELHRNINKHKARSFYEKAMTLVKTTWERNAIQSVLDKL